MAAFERGDISKSAALELSRMDEVDQEELLERGITAHKDIKKESDKRKADRSSARKSVDDRVQSVYDVMELKAVQKAGICPHCGQEIYKSFHERYCGTCGGAVVWKTND